MNIEREFLKFKGKKNLFPNNKDYVAYYEIFKEKFDKELHPEVKTKILEIEKSGYYNDHGVDHIKMVIDRVSKIIECLNPTFTGEKNKFSITPYELFILLMSINLHDTGHLIASRSDHAKAGKKILSKFDSGNLLNSGEKTLIGDIAQAHGGKEDPIGKLEHETSLTHQKVRPQLLSALLRLGDELAEDETRASNFLLDINKIEKTSIIFHLYSSSLNSLSLNGGEINLVFYIMEKHLQKTYEKMTKGNIIKRQYLINEIYERTQKTFLESLYCSRYLPEKARFNKVKVKINLLHENHENIIPPIGFELKENGYPLLEKNDIFKNCGTLLIDGEKIDGKYVSKIIKEQKRQKNEKSF